MRLLPKTFPARLVSLLVFLSATAPLYSATPAALSSSAAADTTMTFDLRDPKTKEVYYTGQETVRQDGQSIYKETLYFDAAKKEVQKENFAFDSASLKALSFRSSNSLTGEQSAVTPKDSSLEVTYKADHEGKTASSLIKVNNDLFLAKAAGDLIVQNWDKLVAGKAIKFDLVVPSRLETIPFQIVKRETLTVDSESREVFALMPQNILIRMLAPHLEFQYNQDKKIRQAVFPSSLPIRGAKDKMVEMVIKS